MKSTTQIGKEFEKRAYDYLKERFEEVVWLSKNQKSSFDFKIKKDGKYIYGDAKYSRFDKVYLLPTQKEASFVITNDGEEILFIEKEAFEGKVRVLDNNTVPIRIGKDVIREIKRIGYMGESYTDVLRRILKMNRRGQRKSEKPEAYEEFL